MSRSKRVGFFFYLASALLIIVLLGFGPSFYFSPMLGVPERFGSEFPFYILVHGIVFSAWFGLLPLQTILVARGNYDIHRKLGLAGIGVAIALVLTGAVTTIQVIPQVEAAGRSLDEVQGLLVGNSIVLVSFVGLFIAAIWKRRTPAVHKRLMVFASCFAIGPALTTNRVLGNALQSMLPDLLAPGLLFWLLVIASMTTYDVVRDGAINSATKLGVGFFALGMILNLIMMNTGLGAGYAYWLATTFIH
jgi:hypothetical protein